MSSNRVALKVSTCARASPGTDVPAVAPAQALHACIACPRLVRLVADDVTHTSGDVALLLTCSPSPVCHARATRDRPVFVTGDVTKHVTSGDVTLTARAYPLVLTLAVSLVHTNRCPRLVAGGGHTGIDVSITRLPPSTWHVTHPRTRGKLDESRTRAAGPMLCDCHISHSIVCPNCVCGRGT